MKDYYRQGKKIESLENARCKFCGCNNKGKYTHIHLESVHGKFGVFCDNCSAQTDLFEKELGAMASWRAGDYTIPIQSEENILKGCIGLLHGLTGEFFEYLEYMGIDQSRDDAFSFNMPVTEIVNRLFLWNTGHSGGTSTRAKCNELGTDEKYGRSITFSCKEEEEEDGNEN